MRRSQLLCFVLVLALIVPTVAMAKRNDPNITLAYTPTTAIAEATAVPTSKMRKASVELVLEDDRGLDDATIIGSRTDDDDRRHDLRATNDLADWAVSSLTRQAKEWTFSMASGDDADAQLVGKITQFNLVELNQAVGASYNGKTTLELELRTKGGKSLWTGTAFGDASRYGKKFSEANFNEVMSDAISEAFANALTDPGLQEAWSGLSD